MAELHRPHGEMATRPVDNVDVHHEESDVNIRAIFGFGGALIVIAIIIHIAIWGLFRLLESRANQSVQAAYPLATGQDDRLPPEPRLQTAPREDLGALRLREDTLLGSYGWVDRNGGVVRIPIERAMQLTLERGLPARQEVRR